MWAYAQHFGWTPAQVEALTMEQHQYYRAGFREMKRQSEA